MKNSISLMMLFFSFLCFSFVNAQEKSKKELKAEQKLKKQQEIETLINSKTFQFEANFVQPQGTREINIQGERYDVNYSPDEIESYLPYFGRAFNISYGGDSGLKFKGKPRDYKIEKKKKFYLITTTVKGENDVFVLSLSVYFEGNATLNVNSNQRNSISYTGTIEKVKEKANDN